MTGLSAPGTKAGRLQRARALEVARPSSGTHRREGLPQPLRHAEQGDGRRHLQVAAVRHPERGAVLVTGLARTTWPWHALPGH
jgi:hypothetical protein